MCPRTDSDRQTFEAAMPEEYRSHSRPLEGTPASEALHSGANVQVRPVQQRNTTLPPSCREVKAAGCRRTCAAQPRLPGRRDRRSVRFYFVRGSAFDRRCAGLQPCYTADLMGSGEETRTCRGEACSAPHVQFSVCPVRSSVSALAHLSSIAMTPIFVWCRIPRALRYHC